MVNKNEQVTKKKGKPRGGNNWLTDAALNVQPGDNTKYIQIGMEVMNLPKIDLHDVDAVNQRLGEYFSIYAKYDTKPTVAGMASALGMSRVTLWAVANDRPVNGQGDMTTLPKEVSNSIKKAYNFMGELWENYMQNGKINPVSGIFLGKNNFGYQDKQEMVLTPRVQNESDFNEAAIRARYELPESTSDE